MAKPLRFLSERTPKVTKEVTCPYFGDAGFMPPDLNIFVRECIEPLVEGILRHNGNVLVVLEHSMGEDVNNPFRMTFDTFVYSAYVFLNNRFFKLSLLRDEIHQQKWGSVTDLRSDGGEVDQGFKLHGPVYDWDQVLANFQKKILQAGLPHPHLDQI